MHFARLLGSVGNRRLRRGLLALSMLVVPASVCGADLAVTPVPAGAASCSHGGDDPTKLVLDLGTSLAKAVIKDTVPGGDVAIGFILKLAQFGTPPDTCAVELMTEINTKLAHLQNHLAQLERSLTAQLSQLSYQNSYNSIQGQLSSVLTASEDLQKLAKLKPTDANYKSSVAFYSDQITKSAQSIRQNQYLIPNILLGSATSNGLVQSFSAAVAAKHPLLTSDDYPAMKSELLWAEIVYATEVLVLMNFYQERNLSGEVQDLVSKYQRTSKQLADLSVKPLPEAVVLDTRQGRNLMWFAGQLPYVDQGPIHPTDSSNAWNSVNNAVFQTYPDSPPWRLASIEELRELVAGRSMANAGDWLRAESGNGGSRWRTLGWNNTDRFWSATHVSERRGGWCASMIPNHLPLANGTTWYCTMFTIEMLNYTTGTVDSCRLYNVAGMSAPKVMNGHCRGHVLMVRTTAESERYYWPGVKTEA